MNSSNPSTFQNTALSLVQKLEKARAELLDLGARNRLLNIPRSKNSRFLEIIDEQSEQIYKLLVSEKKIFTFLHGKAGKEEEDEENQEDAFIYHFDETSNETKPQHLDTKLQTKLTPKGLQKRLIDLYHDAKTLEEEQGVNILYLALGTLKWVDPTNKENIRYAPLILIPVSLERGKAGERFKLKARQEDIIPNLSLEAFLERIHHISIPELQTNDDDEIDVAAYMAGVSQAVSLKQDWEVKNNDIMLGLFSYAKFLMYRDLDPENWPEDESLASKYLIRALMEDGFEEHDDLLAEDCQIDPLISPKEMLHILDSDSSQTLAIHEVRKGKNLVIQGPPGTGKSQTIANIIASSIADGKTVLFVAEKMAALDVVKRRLDYAGVGDACLELHSNKANKRQLLEELKRVWELGSPRGEYPNELLENLTEARDELNDHPTRLHKTYEPSGLTPYQVMGHLVRLRQTGQAPTNFHLHHYEQWNNNDLVKRLNLVQELIERIEDIGLPKDHPWRGVGREEILPSEIERLIPRLVALQSRLAEFSTNLVETAQIVALTPTPEYFSDTEKLLTVVHAISEAPKFEERSLTSASWSTSLNEIKALIDAGNRYQDDFKNIKHHVYEDQTETSLLGLRDDLKTLPGSLLPFAFAASRKLSALLPTLNDEINRLVTELGIPPNYASTQDIKRLIALSQSVASAPDASPEAFIASVWERGVEQATELVDSLFKYQELKRKIESHIFDAAWITDVSQARHHLAIHTGMLRFMSTEWRRSRATTRAVLRNTSQPISEQIALLDDLILAQKLRQVLSDANEFGSSAFSHHWRGENSDSQSLKALVDWMATLKDIGPEARQLASRLSDRDSLRYLSQQLNQTLEQTNAELNQLWQAFGTSPEKWFDNHYAIKRVPLSYVGAIVQKLNRIDDLSRQVLREPTDRLEERLALIEQIISLQYARKSIADKNELGADAFANDWKDCDSDWQKLTAGYHWIAKHDRLRFIVATIDNRGILSEKAQSIHAEGLEIKQTLQALCEELASSTDILLNIKSQDALTVDAVATKLEQWVKHSEQLSKWVVWQHRMMQAKRAGLSEVMTQLEDGSLPLTNGYTAVEYTYYESLFKTFVQQDPNLARFDGELHSRRVAHFAELDLKRIKAASFEVVRAHHKKIPAKTGGAGPVGVLRAEMARKRGHMPIRQLMLKAGPAIQALKPVIMMSPLSVAQFLIPGKQKFDLLVMDEASQIQPVDAIGAIARSQQVIVVGDERQLPPTSFFSRMTEASNDSEDDSTQVADIESILGLFVARGLPQRMLRWHYRSRHQSLIAISNNQFYDNKLFIVPSPYTQEAGMGLRFHYVADGVFESGGSNANVNEAKRVAAAILEHAQTSPNLSLGVATFSVSQRKAIQDELEVLRRLNTQFEDFFHSHPAEPFFIKNLENIQGDERDVIMISVGYAKNNQGYLAMRFGPLGSQGGERRLNVLISRAKRRCEVFASITDEDIDLERAKGVGVFAFKLFLQYARTGRLSLAHSSGRPMDSIFEEQVAAALQQKGYQVHPQVGIAGFFIDLAIADPEMPGRYLLGIECDGSTYHSSRSARERDRLRQAVLEDHGWIIHRIWSTDWFQRPAEQLQHVIDAIETARIALKQRAEEGYRAQRAIPIEIVTVEREDVTEIGLEDTASMTGNVSDYIECKPQVDLTCALHETPSGILANLVEDIVKTESPVHMAEVITRLRNAWGLQRAGARIEAAVTHAAAIACKKGNIFTEGDFWLHKDADITLRNRQNVSSANLRKPEMISPREIAQGIIAVVKTNLGATEEEIVIAVSRMLGFKATSSALKKTIAESIALQVAQGRLNQSGTLFTAEETIVN